MLPVLFFTFSHLPAASSLLGNASSACPSPQRIRRRCSNQLLSAVYSLMCLQPSTSVRGMREVSWGVLPCRVPASWISPSPRVFCSVLVLESGLHTLPADLVAVQQNIRIALDTAVGNQGIASGFLLSSTFCLPSGKAALGAEEAAAVENVHSHAKHRQANHWQVSLQSQQK